MNDRQAGELAQCARERRFASAARTDDENSAAFVQRGRLAGRKRGSHASAKRNPLRTTMNQSDAAEIAYSQNRSGTKLNVQCTALCKMRNEKKIQAAHRYGVSTCCVA